MVVFVTGLNRSRRFRGNWIGFGMNHLISAMYANLARVCDAPLEDAVGVRIRWAPTFPIATIVFPVHRMVRSYADYRALFVVRAA